MREKSSNADKSKKRKRKYWKEDVGRNIIFPMIINQREIREVYTKITKEVLLLLSMENLNEIRTTCTKISSGFLIRALLVPILYFQS